MKRILILGIVATILVTLAGFFAADMCANAATIKIDKFAPQAGLTLKGKLDLGKGYTFTGKEYLSICNGVQPWSYLQFSKSIVTVSIGAVNSYRGKSAVGFEAIKLNVPLGKKFSTATEFYTISHDRDWFNWGLADYNFQFRGRDCFVGIYYELFTPNSAYLQIGPHLGVGNYEIDFLFGKASSAIRFCYTVPVSF